MKQLKPVKKFGNTFARWTLFVDKDQNQGNTIRIEWWNQQALTYRDLLFTR